MKPPLSFRRLQAVGLSTLFLLCTATIYAALGSAASSSPSPQAKRITEFQSEYAALPADTQEQLANGIIAKGQNMKLVYLALGRPSRIVTTPNAKTITWTYHNYVSPVISTNKTVVGRETKQNFANNSPLQDTMDAWNNRLQKHEIPNSPQGSDLTRWEPQIIPKAPTQSWAEYAKYRNNVEMVKGIADRASGDALRAMKNITKRAELEYREALMIPPISSPDPVKLDVVFVDQLVSDAIVDESFSAFSAHALPLTVTATPGVQGQIPE